MFKIQLKGWIKNNMSRKEKLFDHFKKAIEHDVPFMLVCVDAPNLNEWEYIVNSISNYESKWEYYNNAYDDDLCLKANKNIKIVDYIFGSMNDVSKYIRGF